MRLPAAAATVPAAASSQCHSRSYHNGSTNQTNRRQGDAAMVFGGASYRWQGLFVVISYFCK
jgi:hypothetical protein